MKLYGAPNPAPNPRRVRIFLAEKGIDLPETPLDLRQREHKSEAFVAKNSLGQVPALELDDGDVITETTAICRYLDALNPEPPLFGVDALSAAKVDMWMRRVEFQLTVPVGMFWRHAHPLTAALLTQFKDFGQSNAETYANAQRWLDRELADGRTFLVGETYTMADICALSTVDFAKWIGLPIQDNLSNLQRWHERVSARPSAGA